MSDALTSASNSITLRLNIENQPGLFARAVTAIGEAGGNIGAIDIVRYEKGHVVRDVTVDTTGSEQAGALVAGLNEIEGIEVLHSSDRVFVMHLGGKISVESKAPSNPGTICPWRTHPGWRGFVLPFTRTWARRAT